MVRFKNRLTGGDMWVHETRVNEYKAAGHVPVAEVHPEPVTEQKPVKKARKKPAEK